MIKKIILVIGVLLLLSFGFVGCLGGADDGTTPTATIEQRVATLETQIASLGSYATTSALNNVKSDLQSILARVVALENKPDNTAQITALNNELDALESTVSLLTARITTLENAEPVTPVIPIDMLSAYATLQAPYIKITTHAPQAMTVCYEVTFHINNPEEVGAPGDTLDDVMVLLYTDSPVEIKAGSVELIPQFKLMYNADDTQWLLYQVCFTTQGTSVPLGTSVKDITVLVNEVGDFITVKVMPIAATGTTPSW